MTNYQTGHDAEKVAAEMWVSQHKWPGDYQLSAIELTGSTFEITNFLADL